MGGSGGCIWLFDIKEVVYSLVILQLIHSMNYCNIYVVIPGAVIQSISRRIDMHIILILWILNKFIFSGFEYSI